MEEIFIDYLRNRDRASELVIEAGALSRVRTYLRVGYLDVSRMYGIAFERFWALEGAVEHHVSIARSQTAADVDLAFYETWYLANEAFESCLDTLLDCLFLGFGKFLTELPEDDVLNHIV